MGHSVRFRAQTILILVITSVIAMLGTLALPASVETAEAQGAFTCNVSNNDVLSWTNQGVDSYQVRQVVDGQETFLAAVDNATSFALPGFADAYVVRFRDANDNIVDSSPCTGNPLPAFTCSIFIDNGESFVVWNNQQQDNYLVRQVVDGTTSFLGSTSDRFFPVSGTADTYNIRTSINGGQTVEANCAGNPPPAFTCSVSNNVLSWSDQGTGSYQVRQINDGADTFLSFVDDATSFDLPVFVEGYIVRTDLNGTLVSATCSGNPLPAFACSLFVQNGDTFVVWSNQQQDSYIVRHTVDGATTFIGNTTDRFFPVTGLATSYTIRTTINGATAEATCAGNPPAAFSCSVAGDVLSWTCLLYTSPSPRDATLSRMPSSA